MGVHRPSKLKNEAKELSRELFVRRLHRYLSSRLEGLILGYYSARWMFPRVPTTRYWQVNQKTFGCSTLGITSK
jgi:hypothetical protein